MGASGKPHFQWGHARQPVECQLYPGVRPKAKGFCVTAHINRPLVFGLDSGLATIAD
jgi:hypothetical protein